MGPAHPWGLRLGSPTDRRRQSLRGSRTGSAALSSRTQRPDQPSGRRGRREGTPLKAGSEGAGNSLPRPRGGAGADREPRRVRAAAGSGGPGGRPPAASRPTAPPAPPPRVVRGVPPAPPPPRLRPRPREAPPRPPPSTLPSSYAGPAPRRLPWPGAGRGRRALTFAGTLAACPLAPPGDAHSPSAWCRDGPGSAARARALGWQGRRRRTGGRGEPRCPLPHTRAPRPASRRRPPRGRGGGARALGSPGPPPACGVLGPPSPEAPRSPSWRSPPSPARFAPLLPLEFPPDKVGVERRCRPCGEPSSRSQRKLMACGGSSHPP
ncbi:collagen alpha-1(I) chain-like [Prionailurus bengalensis]|uniref:collagen alpha-1(I) chain-like n=1 Tax=Prionailurus bengalensis TaxID=37029 RepID=UPI001CA92404|nr:collagen alpha-1(I) chain-like [Prionailurus bengalensis]